jgi:hypothetical protein
LLANEWLRQQKLNELIIANAFTGTGLVPISRHIGHHRLYRLKTIAEFLLKFVAALKLNGTTFPNVEATLR